MSIYVPRINIIFASAQPCGYDVSQIRKVNLGQQDLAGVLLRGASSLAVLFSAPIGSFILATERSAMKFALRILTHPKLFAPALVRCLLPRILVTRFAKSK